MRLEHIHTLPEPWSVEHDFERVRRWLSLGLDDVLEVSPPWGLDPGGARARLGGAPGQRIAVSHAGARVRDARGRVAPCRAQDREETTAPGWVVQPDHVALFEDFNIPRGVKHAVAGPEDLPKLRYLLGQGQ